MSLQGWGNQILLSPGGILAFIEATRESFPLWSAWISKMPSMETRIACRTSKVFLNSTNGANLVKAGFGLTDCSPTNEELISLAST